MNKLKSIYEKLKKITHIEIYLAVILGVIICFVYLTFFAKNENGNNEQLSTSETDSAVEHVGYLENKLCNVLSKISNVGQASVVITLENGFSYEYATDTETKKTTSGGIETVVTSETIILVGNEPVVQKQIYPKIKGVVIVAEGAENFNVKMNILTAVETVLEIDRNNITILA